ncbi:Astacin (Peptidase M12A) [Parelaphostrongylus tenuis]|uniref:Astacin (Peptidase M12A) n=1 Tax=Parelaphostrongylus tenuis TaxID=148309 RepID=A0AAD5QNQ1_PARTN|nr:Astacin (Peptidase M12A) [Parelaphostrongylus tenuis]
MGDPGSSKTRDEFSKCHYWIQAPSGSTIEIIFDNFTQGVASGGCPYAGVEIKTGKDKRRTGYRFCDSKKAGISLVSSYNIVPIITFNRIYETKAVLRYRIASSGPETSPTTLEPTVETTPQTTANPNCKDSPLCTTLMEWDFCKSPKYEEKLRRLVCPESCDLC